MDKEVNTRGKKLVDCFEKNGLVILNGRFPSDSPAQFTFHGQRGFTVIDVAACIWEHLDIIEDFEVINLVTNSDHMPICIKFKNKTVCDPGLNFNCNRDVIKWNSEKAAEFYIKMENSPTVAWFDGTLDELNANLLETIKDKASELSMVKRQSNSKQFPKDKPWVDLECMHLKKLIRKALKQCKKSNFEPSYLQEYTNLKQEFKKLINKKKEDYNMKNAETISSCSNSNQFWKQINKMRVKNSSNSNKISNKKWHEFLSNQYHNREKFDDNMQDARHPLLDKPVSQKEILFSIKACKNNKAPGSDGISSEFYKSLPQNWLLYLECLFNKIIEKGKVPNA